MIGGPGVVLVIAVHLQYLLVCANAFAHARFRAPQKLTMLRLLGLGGSHRSREGWSLGRTRTLSRRS